MSCWKVRRQYSCYINIMKFVMLLSYLAHSMAYDFRITGNLILTEMRYFLIFPKITFQTPPPNIIIICNVVILSEGDVL
jgi:hypothetical protein